MSCTTAADSRRVTVFQCRSMNTNATTVCRMTMGTIMIRRARAYSPEGIQPLNALPIQSLAAETRPAAVRISVRPVSSVLIRKCSRRCDQAIADAAHRLQEQGIGGIALDLAPQTVDLHVDRTFVDGAVAGERAARHGFAPCDGENAQHLAFAIGEMNDLVALAQFAAIEMIDIGPERGLFQRLHRRRRGALENIADTQHQFARLERFCDIIVG